MSVALSAMTMYLLPKLMSAEDIGLAAKEAYKSLFPVLAIGIISGFAVYISQSIWIPFIFPAAGFEEISAGLPYFFIWDVIRLIGWCLGTVFVAQAKSENIGVTGCYIYNIWGCSHDFWS